MREMIPSDWKAVTEMLSDYPYTTDDGHITAEKVDGYMRRWFQQFNPYVLDINDKAVGFINYQMQGVFLVITHAAVLPTQRQRGYFEQMYTWLGQKLRAEGHEIAYFSVLERSEFVLDKFERQGESQGKTGRIINATTDGIFTADTIL